jgi:CheY-like chemotaxis protein
MNEKCTVLIVDDEPDLCEMLAFEFELKGFTVLCAGDGQEACALLGEHPVRAVITDVRMPRMPGLRLLEHAKGRDVHWPAFVLISAYPDVTPEQAYAMGAEALFSKPFRLAKLVDTVTALVRPIEERWNARTDGCGMRHLQARSDMWRGKRPVLGRGGCVILTEEAAPVRGEQVSFTMPLADMPFPTLTGSAVVRWVRPASAAGQPAACGIEFTHLADSCRSRFVAWVMDNGDRAYIPALVVCDPAMSRQSPCA